MAKKLDSSANVEGDDGDYYDITGSGTSGYTQGRNYFMEVDAFWKAKTYHYEGYVLVYTERPDLEAIEIKATSPLMVNTPVSFSYKIRNNGVSTAPDGYSIEIADTTGSKTVIHTDSFPPLGNGGEQSGVFTYTFTTTGTKKLTLFADSQEKVVESDESNNKKTFTFFINGGITGDFDIIEPTINYRDSFKLVPKNIIASPGCTYQEHYFRLQNGTTWTSPKQTNKTGELVFNYPSNYPPPIAVGSVSVSMMVKGTCGGSIVTTDWITKTLIVNGPTSNDPPYFRLGWFYDGDFTSKVPLTRAVEGARLMVRVVQDPDSTPPSPSDPDGDDTYISGWDFSRSNAWVASLPDRYGWAPDAEYLRGITADNSNTHTIYATMVDEFGASYTAGASISIVPPNPVPIAKCPPVVKENRPVDQKKFDSSGSYSPSGRSIDHSKDEWINKQISYTNGTSDDITVQVQLYVWDTGSPPLKSLYADTCNIIVQPDKPPVGKLDVPPLGIRGQTYDLFNKSYSPDGDKLVSAAYRYKYDANNNGFDDDVWQTMPGDLTKTTFAPSRVGKYLFDVYVCEDYGRCANASDTQAVSFLVLDTMNLEPAVSFRISGKNEQPIVNPPIPISAQTMMSWPLYETNTTTPAPKASFKWSVQNGVLSAGLGKGIEMQYPDIDYYSTFYGDYRETTMLFKDFSDNGFGTNGISPYKPMQSVAKSQPILIGDPEADNLTPAQYKSILVSDKARIYFDSGTSFYALNKSRIPRYEHVNIDLGYNQWGGWNGFTSKHRWLDASPYDYTIDTTASGVGQNVTIPYYVEDEDYEYEQYGTTTRKILANNVLYGFTGKTIYQFVERKVPTGFYDPYDDGSDDYVTYNTDHKLCTFNVSDGSLITCVDITRTGSDAAYSTVKDMRLTRGDHIILVYTGHSYYSNVLHDAREFDSSGNLIATYPIEAQNTTEYHTVREKYYDYWSKSYKETSEVRYQQLACTFSGLYELYKDLENNVYQYNIKTCTGVNPEYKVDVFQAHPEVQSGAYLVKYNPDFTIAWRTFLGGKGFSYEGAGGMSFLNTKTTMAVNPYAREVITRSIINWRPEGSYWDSYNVITTVVDMDTGAARPWTGPAYEVHTSNFHIEPDGSYATGRCSSQTDGSCRSHDNGSGHYITKQGGTMSYSDEKYGTKQFGEYMGDGLYVSIYDSTWSYGGGGFSDGGKRETRYLWLDQGPPSTNPEVRKGFQIGQLVSDTTHGDMELSFTLTMSQPQIDAELTGFSFRMQDPKNRYAVETDGSNLYLSRYINGNRVVLASSYFPAQSATPYAFSVKATGDRLQVSLNGVPYFDVTDGTFASGKIGPFSDKSYVDFSGVTTKAMPVNNIEWLTNYAIFEDGTASAEVRYDDIEFNDPENDPRAGSNRWTYTHTPKFLNNQGVSALNGQTFTSEQVTFDKVGEYWVTLQARDDPHPGYLYPSMVFDNYRKESNAYAQRLIVHRRPIAAFTAWVNGDGTVGWSDTSYDPDRWVNASYYSPPDTTGIDYGATRGIMERKYYYISPSGNYVESKLTRPTEIGTYEVGLIVRDEYGAWSYPVSQTLNVGIIPTPNSRPTATLTFPNGTQTGPNLIYSTRPTITWNQSDTPGTIFQGYHVLISTETGQLVAESGESPQWTTANSAAWNVPVDLPIGTKLQVRVRVSDGEEWSDWSNIGWMIVNSPPSAVLTFPNGATQYSPNIIQDNRRPVITWNQYDAELGYGAVFQGYHVQVLNESGTVVYDYSAGQWTQANSQSMTVTSDLPTGVPLQVRVRVSDGSVWSNWSNIGWMKINMTPGAVVTYPSGTQENPTIDGPTPTITWSQTDPDPDTVFMAYELQIATESNEVIYTTGVVPQNTTNTTQQHVVADPLPAGTKLRVRVRVFDGYVWSAWSSDKWLFTNRPPAAAFTWKVNPPTTEFEGPAWEGDHIQFINQSTDPDGDALTYVWEFRRGGTTLPSSTEKDPLLQFMPPGDYDVTLTVEDPYGAKNSVTRRVTVSPLVLLGYVNHTDEWNEHRIQYNQSKTGTDDDPRTYDVFFPGELFLLLAETQGTVVNVDTEILGTPFETTLAKTVGDAYSGTWEGDLWDVEMIRWESQAITFRFTATTVTGYTKSVDVPIIIDDDQYWRQHRLR